MVKKITKRVGGIFGLNEVRDDLGQLKYANEQHLNTMEANIERLLRENLERFDQIERRLDKIEWQNQQLAKINSLQYESLATIAGGATADSRQRFYQTIAPAYGELRTYQLGCAKLLYKLNEICRKHDLRLWLHCGTLLGAYRNQGFIPWDDDVDTSMMRDDIQKLREILERDPKYQLTLCYDYWCSSRQLRFRTRDSENPCFVDVFIHDYSDETNTMKESAEWQERKAAIRKKFEEIDSPAMKAWREKGIIGENDQYGDEIGRLFAEYYPEPGVPKSRKSTSVMWSLDNLDVCGPKLFAWEAIFPTVTIKFEGMAYPAPRDAKGFLTSLYGDFYEIPNDLASHFQHVDQENWNITAVERFLQEK